MGTGRYNSGLYATGLAPTRAMKILLAVLLVPCLASGVALAAPQESAKKSAQDQSVQGEAHWANWRGPNLNGIAPDNSNPPTEWSEKKNIRWKIDIPGLGSSSPIVFGDRIYVTTSVETNKKGKAAAPANEGRGGRRGRGRGRFGRRGRRGPPTKVHEFSVLAINRKNGKVVWNKIVKKGVPHEAGHNTASQASNSPLTDGEHIYAFFGSRGLYCMDMKGKVKWSKQFGTMRTSNGFGEGTSPSLYGDTLIINWDHEGDSWIAAFRKSDGKRIWRKERNERTTWCTPLITPVNGRPQVIVSASRTSRAYDLKTGKLIWSCSGMVANCIPSPIHVDGIVYLMSGHRGNSLQAIKVKGAKGDITDSEKHLLWEHRQSTSYTPSGLVYDGNIYFLRSNNGLLSCLDAKTGKVHYQGQRLSGIRNVYSSPVGAAGRIYITGREGVTKVIKPGGEYEELASNRLDDGFDATAAIVGNELYLRGRKHLYCIASKKKKRGL